MLTLWNYNSSTNDLYVLWNQFSSFEYKINANMFKVATSTSLSPPPPHPTPLGHHRAPSWTFCSVQQLPTSYFIYIYLFIYMDKFCKLAYVKSIFQCSWTTPAAIIWGRNTASYFITACFKLKTQLWALWPLLCYLTYL